jgi:ABC-type maltose transport system permease subunit
MQTKKQSFLESITNTSVGFVISLGATFVIFPLVGVESTGGKNILITIFFTAVSIARSYLLRRYFNNINAEKETCEACQKKKNINHMHTDNEANWFCEACIKSSY